MALHTELSVYKTTYELLGVVPDLVKNMRRDFKRNLGQRLLDECVDLTVEIFRANCAQEKELHLISILERQQVIELLLRLSRDKRLISTGGYATAIKLTTSIGKQVNGWRRSTTTPDSRRPRPS